MTKIEWAEEVWNPVTGCTKVSPGCQNCYAERMSTRLAGRHGYPADEPFVVTLHPDKVGKPLKWITSRKVFVCSMGDLFHYDVKDDWILAVFVAMGLTYRNTGEMKEISPGHKVAIHEPKHTFMILTKRPERMKNFILRLLSKEVDEEWDKKAHIIATNLAANDGSPLPGNAIFTFGGWVNDGMPGLWLGVTCENQEQSDKRIPVLLQIPTAVRFVSVEPMLGPVDLTPWFPWDSHRKGISGYMPNPDYKQGLHWVVCGGESGPGARPMHPDWARGLRDQCVAAGVPYFFKQHGEWQQVGECMNSVDDAKFYKKANDKSNFQILNREGGCGFHGLDSIYMKRVGKKKAGRILDGRTWDEFPGVR